MKSKLNIIFSLLFLSLNTIIAQDMLPSDVYYKDNIAVNNVAAESPSLVRPGTGGPTAGGPGTGGPGTGGPETGNGEWGGEAEAVAPIGEATLPLLAISLAYVGFVLYRKSKRTEKTIK